MSEREMRNREELVEEEIVGDDIAMFEEVIHVDDDDSIMVRIDDMDLRSAADYVHISGRRESQHRVYGRPSGNYAEEQLPQMGIENLRAYHGFPTVAYRIEQPTSDPVYIRSATAQGTNAFVRNFKEYKSPGRFFRPIETANDQQSSYIPRPSYHMTQISSSHMAQYEQNLDEKKKLSPANTKKPCNCTKSMCLKLYCECFANGEFCHDCNCKSCYNNMEHKMERSKAIKASLDRNPNAFKPKIGVGSRGRIDLERLHQKGCHCRKSYCLKNYCECYEAKVPCTERCKCIDCKNTETDRAGRFSGRLVSIADMSSVDECVLEVTESLSSNEDEIDQRTNDCSDQPSGQWFQLSDELIEATTSCLIERAAAIEPMKRESDADTEREILEEFGYCLGMILSNFKSSV